MKRYIKTEIVKAKPMTYKEYIEVYPKLERERIFDDDTEGYGIFKIMDNSVISSQSVLFDWLTVDEFKAEYKETEGMTFGHAIEAMKAGFRVARKGWNGKGMYCIYFPGSKVKIKEGTPYYNAITNNGAEVLSEEAMIETLPHLDMWTVNSKGERAFLSGWLASQTDMLSNDWEIV